MMVWRIVWCIEVTAQNHIPTFCMYRSHELSEFVVELLRRIPCVFGYFQSVVHEVPCPSSVFAQRAVHSDDCKLSGSTIDISPM
jgi:hypothetical protein